MIEKTYDEEEFMVKHIVCYKFANPDEETIAKTKAVFESMIGRVPEVKSLAAGADVLHSPRSFDMVLEVVFDSFEDMANYQKNEYHVSVVKKHVHSVVEKSVSVDYEF